MASYDLVVLVVILGFIGAGFRAGLIQTLGSIIGLALGVLIAYRNYQWLANVIEPVSFGNNFAAQIVAFILIFLLVSQAVGMIAWTLGKAFNLLAIIPGLGLINRLGGALLGFIEGIFVIGIILDFSGRLIQNPAVSTALSSSQLATFAIKASQIFTPFLPAAFEKLKSLL